MPYLICCMARTTSGSSSISDSTSTYSSCGSPPAIIIVPAQPPLPSCVSLAIVDFGEILPSIWLRARMSEKRPSDDAQGGPKGKRTKPTEQKFQGVEVILCCSPVSATEAMNIQFFYISHYLVEERFLAHLVRVDFVSKGSFYMDGIVRYR